MIVGFKNRTFKEANKDAAQIIKKMRRLDEELVLACYPVVLKLKSEGYPEDLVFEKYYDVISDKCRKHDLNKENFASYLTNGVRFAILDALRNQKRHAEILKGGVDRYKNLVHAENLNTDCLVMLEEMQEEYEKQLLNESQTDMFNHNDELNDREY